MQENFSLSLLKKKGKKKMAAFELSSKAMFIQKSQ